MNAPTAPDSWFERRTSIRFPVGPPTVVDVIERAAASAPERLALIDGGRTWTYAELISEAEQLAGALSASGVEPGDRVVWTLPNSAEVVIGFVAATFITAVSLVPPYLAGYLIALRDCLSLAIQIVLEWSLLELSA